MKRLRLLIGLAIVLTTFPLLSDPIEKVSPEQGKVLDSFRYSWEWEDEKGEISIPEEGDLTPNNSEMPIAEVLSRKITKLDGKTHAEFTIRYFLPGEYMVPVYWTLEKTKERVESTKSFKVVSALSQNEIQEAEEFPPILFGKFLWHRLILILLAIGLVVVSAYYLFIYFKNKPIDVIVLEEPPPITSKEQLDSKIRKLFSYNKIHKKEFAYLLTEYLKSSYSAKFGEDLFSYTDSKLLEKIYKSSPIHHSDLRETKVFFLYSKYLPNEDYLEIEEAKSILDQWKRRLE
jgi:hypothetical protein